jgi:hypothetical protein
MAEVVSSETDAPLDQRIAALRVRIARWLLWVGAVEVLMCSLAIWLLTVVRGMTVSQFAPNADDATREQIALVLSELQQWAMPVVVLIAILGIVPGVAYIVLGPAIRRGSRRVALWAQALLLLQIFILAGDIVVSLYSAIASGSPAQFSLRVVVIGTFVAMLIFIVQRILELRQCQAARATQGATTP